MSSKSIKKRDGRIVAFDQRKISTAILKAFDAAYQPNMAGIAERLAIKVSSILEVEGAELPEVEHVQDLVELVLMEEDYPAAAKAYILYRSERARARALGERLKKIYEGITWSSAKTSDWKRENANINGDTAMGNLLKYGSESAKAYFQAYVLKP
ncbi:ATP cone domain-containing protein, partial [Oscillibacter ruminantium]